jgi:hypothetical protein
MLTHTVPYVLRPAPKTSLSQWLSVDPLTENDHSSNGRTALITFWIRLYQARISKRDSLSLLLASCLFLA